MSEISPWVLSARKWLPTRGKALDVAAGRGRHTRYLLQLGLDVQAVDIDISHLQAEEFAGAEILTADLEGDAWPFDADVYNVVLVSNYLWRPHFPEIRRSLKPGGLLVWDTFSAGNEAYGRPSNPEFLLEEGELLQAFSGFQILDFADGYTEKPTPAMRQSIICRKPD